MLEKVVTGKQHSETLSASQHANEYFWSSQHFL